MARTALMVAAIVPAASGVARAQGVEALGSRALGMAGAFVAVADDATATYWNPAGLATGAFFSAVFEWQTSETGEKGDPPFRDLQGGSSSILAVVTPPLGVTYYRLRATRLFAPGPGAPTGGPLGSASSLVTHHTGVTLVQSLSEHLHVGTTLKYVRGSARILDRTDAMQGDDALERVDEELGRTSEAFDLDIGVMAVFGALRAGLLVRNATEPTFDAPSVGGHVSALPLQRQVRGGISWQTARGTMLSADVDVTQTDTELGRRRHVAVGGEHWFANRRLGVRGGLRANTIDDADPAASAGVSVAITPSISIDSFITRGASQADRAWGLSGRLSF